MIGYPPTCKSCESDAQIYFEEDNIYVCETCSMKIIGGGTQVDLPRLSKAISAIEYSKYTLAQMKKFIKDFEQQANLQKISPMVVEYEKELYQYLEDIAIIEKENRWDKMVDKTKSLQEFMKTIQDSEAMRQVNIELP